MEPERGRKVQGGKSLTATNQNAEPKEVRHFCNSVTSILEGLQKQSISEQVKFVFVWPSGNRSQLIDEEILKMVEGVDIDFAELPSQEKPAHNHTFSTEEIHAIDLEVSESLRQGIHISNLCATDGE